MTQLTSQLTNINLTSELITYQLVAMSQMVSHMMS